MSLQDKIVVVIGGSAGIGFAVAKLAREAGANVLVGGRNKDKLAAAEQNLPGIETLSVDASNESQVVAFFEHIGELDHLVVTVTVTGPGRKALVDLPTQDARAAFDNKFWGHWLAARHGAPRIRAGGSIGLTSGMLSRRPGVGSLLQTTINAGVEAMGRALAKDLAPTRVYVVSPGLVNTESAVASRKRREPFATEAHSLPDGTIATPEEAAACYLFAMQNGSLTGAVIDIDIGAAVK